LLLFRDIKEEWNTLANTTDTKARLDCYGMCKYIICLIKMWQRVAVSLRKTLNVILEPRNLSVVVTQPDKRRKQKPFCVGVLTDTERNGSNERERERNGESGFETNQVPLKLWLKKINNFH